MPETPRGDSPPAAGRLALHLFAWVLLATLAVDAASILLLPDGPFLGGAGRWTVGLGAGWLGIRRVRGFVWTVAATWGGMVLATLLTAAVYILTGRAAADFLGPAATIALLLAGAVIGILAPTAGALARLAVGLVRPGRT
jgi:hypothetical protein